MSTWKPIETAPRDGTEVWLFDPEETPSQFVGYYGWYSVNQGERGWLVAGIETAILNPEVAAYGMFCAPTHWMPLPANPPQTGVPASKDQGRKAG